MVLFRPNRCNPIDRSQGHADLKPVPRSSSIAVRVMMVFPQPQSRMIADAEFHNKSAAYLGTREAAQA